MVDLPNNVERVWYPQEGSQELFLSCPIFECLYEGTRGPGKSQPIDAIVMTPKGPRRIGDLRPGDEVTGSDGRTQSVLSVHPQGLKELWRLTFTDGSTCEASPDHLWQTAATGPGTRWAKRVCTTREMAAWMTRGKTLSVPIMSGPIQLPKAELPIDPYLMGLYLGDGCSIQYSVTITTTDCETVSYLMGLGFKFKAPISYRAPGVGMLHALRSLGLEGLTSADKFVPEAYLWAAADQRLAILQGLMDSDGSVKRNKNQLRFGSISLRLADAVVHLIRSLGGWAKRYALQRPSKDGPEYEVTGYLPDMASAFRLTRKQALCRPRDLQSSSSRVKRYVASIEPIGECQQVCLRVSNSDSLYVTGDFVVTHNTDALLMDFLQHVGLGLGADWRGILFRRSHPELADVIAKSQKWFRRIFPGAEYNKVEKTWTFNGGEQLMFRHIKTVDDYWNYHGHAYPWIAWEELTNWSDDAAYRKMMSCCRSSNPKVPRKYRATANPYGVGHNWVKRRFRLPGSRGIVIRDARDSENELEPPRVAIHGHIMENRILLDADPNYISRLRAAARNPSELKAWLKGDWDIVAGGMFDDVWNPKKCVLEPFPIPVSWRVDRSFDWGSSRPFSVGWWAESDGTTVELPNGRRLSTVRGDLFRINEWYGCDVREHNTGLKMSSADIAKGIKAREAQMINSGLIRRLVSPGPADTSIWDAVPGVPSIAMDMQAKGVLWEKADKSTGSRKQGWIQMRKYLSDAQRDAPREAPGMFIFRTCHHWLDLVPVLPRDDNDLDDVDTDAEDHIGDETRYRVRAAKRNMRQGNI